MSADMPPTMKDADQIDSSDGFARTIRVDELAPGATTVIEIDGREIALVNLDGEFHAIDNRCPHADGPLGEGFVQEGRIVCPLHYWEFDLRTGASLDDPEMCVRRYETKIVGPDVLVRLA
jgi:nitrite reductase (NADH) small subunit